jgi:hypothetical protein
MKYWHLKSVHLLKYIQVLQFDVLQMFWTSMSDTEVIKIKKSAMDWIMLVIKIPSQIYDAKYGTLSTFNSQSLT